MTNIPSPLKKRSASRLNRALKTAAISLPLMMPLAPIASADTTAPVTPTPVELKVPAFEGAAAYKHPLVQEWTQKSAILDFMAKDVFLKFGYKLHILPEKTEATTVAKSLQADRKNLFLNTGLAPKEAAHHIQKAVQFAYTMATIPQFKIEELEPLDFVAISRVSTAQASINNFLVFSQMAQHVPEVAENIHDEIYHEAPYLPSSLRYAMEPYGDKGLDGMGDGQMRYDMMQVLLKDWTYQRLVDNHMLTSYIMQYHHYNEQEYYFDAGNRKLLDQDLRDLTRSFGNPFPIDKHPHPIMMTYHGMHFNDSGEYLDIAQAYFDNNKRKYQQKLRQQETLKNKPTPQKRAPNLSPQG